MCMCRKAQAFLRTDAEKSAPNQRVAEQSDDAILQFAIEIDQDVATRDQMHFAECCVGHEAMVGKDGALAEGLVEHGPVVIRGIVIGQRRVSARQPVVFREEPDAFEGIYARLRCLERGGVDVGRVKDRPFGQTFLGEEDRKRIKFFITSRYQQRAMNFFILFYTIQKVDDQSFLMVPGNSPVFENEVFKADRLFQTLMELY